MSDNFLLFTFMLDDSNNKNYMWLLMNDTMEKIENHKRVFYPGEYDRLFIVKPSDRFNEKDRKITLVDFNDIFMKENKISCVPDYVQKMRKETEEHILRFSRMHYDVNDHLN